MWDIPENKSGTLWPAIGSALLDKVLTCFNLMDCTSVNITAWRKSCKIGLYLQTGGYSSSAAFIGNHSGWVNNLATAAKPVSLFPAAAPRGGLSACQIAPHLCCPCLPLHGPASPSSLSPPTIQNPWMRLVTIPFIWWYFCMLHDWISKPDCLFAAEYLFVTGSASL